ncbi:hypothetical protein [Cellulomonas hominis]|uniref:hypothetical protein n=1 Tax=Cellulomonas hominis TaxID=156981 RepID=UPI001B96D85A|nr:hypothetical protein [Cellulomonas hominis]VTR75859.1 hypothetical protein CHMI_00612 [Cellulomonas hominis]
MSDTVASGGAAVAAASNGRPRHVLLVSEAGTSVVAAAAGPRGREAPGDRPGAASPARRADAPSIPPRVRTVAYFTLLITSWTVLLVSGLAPIWLETTDLQRILATCGVVSSLLGAIAGGLGVAYRPTADPDRRR